jgi:hypothetical protein
MKRLAFWIIVGIVAVNLYRGQSCARDGRDPGPVDVVARDEDSRREARDARHRDRDRNREWVEGVPVPIVPETRVTEAEVEAPRTRPEESSLRSRTRKWFGPMDKSLRSMKRKWTEPAGTREIVGQLSATEPRAVADARVQLERAADDWLTPDVPRSWKAPSGLIDAMVLDTQIQPVVKDYGTLYEATLRADFSPDRRDKFVRVYERELVARRLALLGGVLGFVLACLAALAGYIRADEATKGYYTNRLRLIAAAGVGAAGVAIYRILV